VIFKRQPEVEKKLWGGKFWTIGYYANTVGQYGNEDLIRKYVEDQGKNYEKIYEGQLKLF
jgi:REP element-mobilizing transposase RayT